MATYSHKVFFTETRGTGTYTRVQIDIDGDKEPLIINLDIPGIAPDAGAVLDDAIKNAVAQRVAERSGALTNTEALKDRLGSEPVETVAPKLQEQLNTVAEELGMTTVVLPIKDMTVEKADSLRTWLVDNAITADIAPTTRDKIITDTRVIGDIGDTIPVVRG